MACRISAHPDVDFLVIVNPNSGPGGVPIPSHDYVREVPKLNEPANVCTVGYIRIDYCRKPLSEVYAEIETYAGWPTASKTAGLHVEGIYVDETPNHHSAERAEYLDDVCKHIKSMNGFPGKRLVSFFPPNFPQNGNENYACVQGSQFSFQGVILKLTFRAFRLCTTLAPPLMPILRSLFLTVQT